MHRASSYNGLLILPYNYMVKEVDLRANVGDLHCGSDWLKSRMERQHPAVFRGLP